MHDTLKFVSPRTVIFALYLRNILSLGKHMHVIKRHAVGKYSTVWSIK